MRWRIRVQIGELAVRGASALEARRLQDALARELERSGEQLLAAAKRSHFKPEVSAGRVDAPRRIELCAAALSEVVRRALKP